MIRTNSFSIKYVILVLMLTLAHVSAAEKTALTADYYASRTAAIAAAEEATLDKYPDADQVLLDQATKIKYNRDGTYTQWVDSYTKILTEKGRKENLTVSSVYTIPYQNPEDCRVDLIEIIHEDGTTETIDIAAESSTSISSSNMGSNIYNPNDKIITVNVSNLRVNDILHYRMYDKRILALAGGIFEDMILFEGTAPIIKKNLTVIGSSSFPLKTTEVLDEIPNTVKFSKKEADGKLIYQWIGSNIAQTIPEPDMPALSNSVQRLIISTASSWEEISRWYWSVSEAPLADTTESMKEKVAELLKGAKTPQEKIERMFKYVSQDIRYMGITTESISPGREPHPVSQTFDAKYGVCRDKAALLAAMLRLGGVEAFPVLISTRYKYNPSAPLSFFDHAIAAARVDGEYILMDPTDESTQQLLPSYLNDKSYLVATPEGDTLRTSPVPPASENMLLIETTGKLSENGQLQASSTLRFEGINDNLFRSYFSRINPDERKRLFQSYIRKIYGSGTIIDCTITPENLLDTTETLKVKISYKADNILASGKGLALMPAPFISSTIGLANNIFHYAELEKRRFPLSIDFTSGVKENVKISLSPEIKKIISIPIYSPINSENLEWKRSLAEVKNNIIGSSELLIKTPEFSATEYLELKKALRAIEYNSRKKTVLEVKEEAAKVVSQAKDADIISNVSVTYNILSASSWERTEEVKKRILTYAGKKDHSEIKINYNPAWEEVELIKAIVTTKDGKMQTISEQEINIMDQPWNGLAPRYSGGKTLIASLPAVNIGSLIEYKVKHTYKKRAFFSLLEVFQSFNPLSKSVTIKGADELLVQSLWNAPEIEANFDNSEYSWSMSSSPIKRELFLAPASSFLPAVTASNGSWYSYRTLIDEKFAAASENQEESILKATELTKDIPDKKQQIKLIRDFIVKNIRLAGPNFSGLPLSAITPADETLLSGYGNTTDRAILFYTMLKAIGMEPEYHITTPYIAAEGLRTPILDNAQNNLLENVLVKVMHEGKAIWLNDTTEYAQLGTTPSSGKIAFNLQTAGFTEIKLAKNDQTEQDTFYFLDISDNGDATVSVTKEYYGRLHERYNKLFSEMTPEEKKIFYQEELSGLAQSATADSELKTEFATYPGKVTYRAEVAKYGVKDNNYLYFNLPRTLARLFELRADSRENPLLISNPINRQIHILIALPKSYRIPEITPADFKWVSPLFNGKIEVDSILITPQALRSNNLAMPISMLRNDMINTLNDSRNALYITLDSQVAPALYPASLYDQVLQAQNKLSIPSAHEIMLRTSSSENEQ